MASPATAVTPYRRTRVRIDVPEYVAGVPPWAQTRSGKELAAAPPAGAPVQTQGVWQLASGAWQLLSYTYFPQEVEAARVGTIRLPDATVPEYPAGTPLLTEVPMFGAPTSLIGVGAKAGVTSGDHWLMKRILAGQTWLQRVEADQMAFPGPNVNSVPPVDPNVPFDRVLVSKASYPANTGFTFRWIAPGNAANAPDHLIRMHFGGPTEISGGGVTTAGRYSIGFKGDGHASVYEFLSDTWRRVREFRFAPLGQVAGRVHTLHVHPHGKGNLDLAGSAITASPVPTLPSARSLLQVQPGDLRVMPAPFIRSRKPGGTTGPGPVRVDARRWPRIPFQVARHRYAATGTIVDAPFPIAYPMSAGMAATYPLHVRVIADCPAGTSVTVAVRETATHAELAQPASGTFTPLAGCYSYYLVITLNADAAGERTPTVYGWKAWRDGAYKINAPGETSFYPNGRVAITGPDLDPTHETASVQHDDLTNALPGLRLRARQATRIVTTHLVDMFGQVDTTQEVTLHEGELQRAPGRKRGRSGRAYPHPEWRQYLMQFGSKGSRLQDQLSLVNWDFTKDESEPEDPDTGQPRPYRVTSIIRALFNWAGEPDACLDIPDLPIRAYPSAGDDREYLVQVGTTIIDYIQMLAREYLGGMILREPNAGTYGIWRFFLPPTSYTPIWTFYGRPSDSGMGAWTLPASLGSYPASTAFFTEMTTHVKPPEANLVVVVGCGGVVLPGETPTGPQLVQFACNPTSYDWDPAVVTADPTSPDYLGRPVAIIYKDKTLESQEMVNIACYRLGMWTLFSQKWVEFTAPLVFYSDPGGQFGGQAGRLTLPAFYRPLRIYDVVRLVYPGTDDAGAEVVRYATVLLRSVNPEIDHDAKQMMRCEGIVASDGVLGA